MEKSPQTVPEKKQRVKKLDPMDYRGLSGGGSLAYVFAGENMHLRASPASVAAGPKSRINLPN